MFIIIIDLSLLPPVLLPLTPNQSTSFSLSPFLILDFAYPSVSIPLYYPFFYLSLVLLTHYQDSSFPRPSFLSSYSFIYSFLSTYFPLLSFIALSFLPPVFLPLTPNQNSNFPQSPFSVLDFAYPSVSLPLYHSFSFTLF